MATADANAERKLEAFLLSIEDEALISKLLARPRHAYEKRHADPLRQIARHLGTTTGGVSKGASKPRHPFRTIMNLSSLEPCIDPCKYLDREGFKPADFLAGGGIEEHRFGSTGNTGDDFLGRYEFTLALTQQCPSEHKLRWCLTMLGYFDLVRLICNGKSAKKVGKLMMTDLDNFLSQLTDDTSRKESILENINIWSNYGSKLDEFCQAFKGEGCLLYLADKMSADFLSTKYRRSSERADEAFRYLRELGLETRAETERANEFAKRMREHFIHPFEPAS